MTLSGLLDVVLPDPGMTQAVSSAGVASLELSAPPAVQPLVAAALAAEAGHGGAGLPVLVVTAGRTGRRGPGRRAALLRARPTGRDIPPGRRCRTSGSGPAPTPSAAGSRCCAGCAPGTDARRQVRSVLVAPVRSVLQPLVARSRRPGARSSCPGRRRASTWRTGRRGWSTPPTPGWSWSRSAASSPSAAACSTSSRPPSRTRCGWSSGATRSTSCATSPRPTSARSTSGRDGCGRRRAASCCSPRGARARRRSWPREHPELAEILGKLAEGIAVEGMESLAPVLVDDMRAAATDLPRRHARAGLRPRAGAQPGGRPGAHRRGVPRGVLVAPRRRRAGADRPRARRRSATWPRCETAAASGACRGGRRAPFTAEAEDDDERAHPRRGAGRAVLRRPEPGHRAGARVDPRRAGGCVVTSPGPVRRSAPPTSSPRPTSASGSCPTIAAAPGRRRWRT